MMIPRIYNFTKQNYLLLFVIVVIVITGKDREKAEILKSNAMRSYSMTWQSNTKTKMGREKYFA